MLQFEVNHGVIEALDFSHSEVTEVDAKIWTEFLGNRPLDRQLHQALLKEMPSLSGEINTKLKSLLTTLCPVNL